MYTATLTLLVLFSPTLVSSESLLIDGVRNEGVALAETTSICEDTDGLCSKLVCAKDKISVTLNVPSLEAKEIDIPNIHLRDRRCTGFPYDDVKMNIEWTLGNYICGTEFSTIDNNGVYKNQIFLPPGGLIYRHQYVINVTCKFPLDYDVSLPEYLRPDVSITYIGIENVGQFQVKMSIYKDISYTTPYTDPVISLSTTQNLYVGVYIVDPVPDYSLLMLNCFSTPTNNFYDPKRYDIISNKCRNPQDSTIAILENGVSTFGKFYIQMFKFVGDYSYVFLHCQVHLCSGVCPPSCSSKAASNALESHGTLTLGPIHLSDKPTDGGDKPTDGGDQPTGGVGKASGLSLLTMIGLVLINSVFL